MHLRAFIIGFSAVLVSSFGSSNSCRADEPIRLYALLGLTGDANEFGSIEREGIVLAVEEWNASHESRHAELIVEDTQSDSAKLVSAYRKMVEIDKADVIIGPTWLDTFQAVVPLALRSKTLLVTPSADAEVLKLSKEDTNYILTTYFRSRTEIEALLKDAKDRGLIKWSALYEEEPFFIYVRGMLYDLAPKYGIELVDEVTLHSNSIDLFGVATRLKKSAPQVVFVGTSSQSEIIQLAKAQQQLLSGTLLYGIQDFDGHLKNREISSLIKNLRYSHPVIQDQNFKSRFVKRWGHPPVLTASNAFDAAKFILSAYESGATSSAAVSKFLHSHVFHSASSGEATFQSDGGLSPPKVEVVSFGFKQ